MKNYVDSPRLKAEHRFNFFRGVRRDCTKGGRCLEKGSKLFKIQWRWGGCVSNAAEFFSLFFIANEQAERRRSACEAASLMP